MLRSLRLRLVDIDLGPRGANFCAILRVFRADLEEQTFILDSISALREVLISSV